MKEAALFIWPLFFLFSYILFRKSRLSMNSSSYSDVGSHARYGLLFNLLLVVTGTIQFIFLVNVLRHILLSNNLIGVLGLFCLILTTLTGILTGIITLRRNKMIHESIATTGFIFSIIGYFLLGIYMHPINLFVGSLMFFWGCVVMPYQVIRFIVTKKVYAKNEKFMFIGAFLTNIAFVTLFF